MVLTELAIPLSQVLLIQHGTPNQISDMLSQASCELTAVNDHSDSATRSEKRAKNDRF